MKIKKMLPFIAMLFVVWMTGCKDKDNAAVLTDNHVVSAKEKLAVSANTYPNPLGPHASDPGVTYTNGTYYAYCTSGSGTGSMPIKWSTDLFTWTDNGARVFPSGQAPAWVVGGAYWGPEVHYINGKYVCYYSAKGADGWFKIGVATSSSPEGPFTDKGSPLVSNANYSLIGPTFFRDPATGKNYILWKNNTNALDPPQKTHLVLREVTQDGLTLLGSSNNILWNTLAWEDLLIESPFMMYRNGYYYLFYSGNNYGTDKYAMGVARSTTIGGTYTKKGAPILVSDATFNGPGSGSIVSNSPLGGNLLFYHARLRSEVDGSRYLMMDRINWGSDNWPTIHDGTPSN
ncbi:MAG TPA: glycoside hydrolase family 43 protein [Sphingobacteriaceae bacterium]|nr:glycoside hydrolase family 43 protein [Sphingobacteriaceae bacterium]